jgi:hypothetical protein
MSVSAVSGIAQITQTSGPQASTPPASAVTPFGQQLDAQTARLSAARHHEHHGDGLQSLPVAAASAATAAATTAASAATAAAGATPTGAGIATILKVFA